jgi:hypothetical protein
MNHHIENLIRQGIIHIRPDERFGLVQTDIPEFTQEATVYKSPKLVVKIDDLWVQSAKDKVDEADGLRIKMLEEGQALYVFKEGSYFVDGTQPKWDLELEA